MRAVCAVSRAVSPGGANGRSRAALSRRRTVPHAGSPGDDPAALELKRVALAEERARIRAAIANGTYDDGSKDEGCLACGS